MTTTRSLAFLVFLWITSSLSARSINASLGTWRIRPVFGYRPYDGNAKGADNFAIYKDRQETYIAVINFANTSLTGTLPFEAIGVSGTCLIKELWTGEEQQQPSFLPYSIPAKDARIYRLTKKN